MSLYVQDGVAIGVGDDFSGAVHRICKRSWENSPYVEVIDFAEGRFRGPRGVRYINLPQDCINLRAPDGVGTKVVIHASADTLPLAAWDVFTMTSNDISRWGGMPLEFANVLDVESLGKPAVQEQYLRMFASLERVASMSGVVLMGGETAELGSCVGSEYGESLVKFNWAGFASGVVTKDKLIDGSRIKPGDVVVALQEDGFRSNGISSVRAALRIAFGDDWYKNQDPEVKKVVKAAAAPSIPYDALITAANGWHEPDYKPLVDMKAIAHISGGGIPGKFARDILFPLGLSAELDDLWDPPRIMKQCVTWRGMPDREAYEVFNGGQGMLVVLNKRELGAFMRLAELHNRPAKVCGTIFSSRNRQPVLIVYSKFDTGAIEYT